jgi:hypothetical protein
MRVEAVDPENRILDAIADAVVSGKLHRPAETKRAQGRIVKDGRSRNVRDADTRMVDHRNTLHGDCLPL